MEATVQLLVFPASCSAQHRKSNMYLDDTKDLRVNEWTICHIVRLTHISMPVLALSVSPRLLKSDTQQFPDSSLCTIPYCQQTLVYYPVIQSGSFDFLDEQLVMIPRWPG